MNPKTTTSKSAAQRREPPLSAGERNVSIEDSRRQPRTLRRHAEIMIVHGGDVYRLRLTAQNKLILTK